MKSECTIDLLCLKKIIQDLNESEYLYRSTYLFDATIGQHVRHILEFYICLLEGVENGKVNYDLRQRNILIENSKDFAIKTIDNIIVSINNLNCDLKLVLEGNFSKESNVGCICQTTVVRELIYCFEHSIHHQALLKVSLSEQKINIPVEMGIAPSTFRHLQSNNQTQQR